MYLPFFIAGKYLFSRKSSHVINIISLISAIGIVLGSMAFIVILSVYNGFDTLITSLYESHQADIIVSPRTGKTIRLDAPALQRLPEIPGIALRTPVIRENVFIQYGENQSVARIKGIDSAFAASGKYTPFLKEGRMQRFVGDIPQAVVGEQLAQNLQLRTRFITPLELYFPDRKEEISLINPLADLHCEIVYPGGILSLKDTEFDQNGLLVPIEIARKLLDYDPQEATELEIYLTLPPATAGPEMEEYTGKTGKETAVAGKKQLREAARLIEEAIGEEYIVKDRYRQNETLYKMTRSEKFTVYLILFFVILVISVNIFGSLSMLILEKQDDIRTYISLGAPYSLIKRTFVLQGWLISLAGAAIGIILGLILCFLQQSFGIISMPGNYIVNTYPIEIRWSDIVITFTGIAAIGYLIASLPVRIFK